MNEIAEKTGFDTAKISQALRKLENVRIIRKDMPILNEKNKKLTQYCLRDGMFRFWFRFVTKGTAAIEHNFGEEYFCNMVRPYMHDYMGNVFETICQEYTFRQGMTGSYGTLLMRVGKWRGNDSQKKCPADIDVVVVNDIDKTAVIGECKFKTAVFGKEEYETLRDRARLLSPYKVEHFLVFSLSGVSDFVEEQKAPDVEVISMEQIFSQGQSE